MVGSAIWKQFASIMEQVLCNLCGHSEYTIEHKGPDLLFNNRQELFTLVKCTNCGLIYQNPRPTSEEVGKYYPTEYEPFFQETKQSWFLKTLYHYGVDKRSRIVNSLKRNREGGRLLDIGCSYTASIIQGKSVEELRQFFHIENDLTPEEEKKIIEEFKWCEEINKE